MKTIQIFQARPVGTTTGNYSLSRQDVAELLADVIYLPEGKEAMQHAEDFDGDAKILEVSSYSNGATAKVEVADWVLDAMLSRRELRTLSVEGINYSWKGKWVPDRVDDSAPLATLSGSRLKQIRTSLGMTQEEFGQYLGQSALRTVQAWEKGERSIPSTVTEILRLKGHL